MAVNKVVYAGETLIDLSGDTVDADKLLQGTKAHNAAGEEVAGTIPNHGAVSTELSAGGSVAIAKGYHDGNGQVTAKDLASQTAATASAANIASGKTAWVNGSQVVGSHVCASEYELVSVAADSTQSNPKTFVSSLSSISQVLAAYDASYPTTNIDSLSVPTICGFSDNYVWCPTASGGYSGRFGSGMTDWRKTVSGGSVTLTYSDYPSIYKNIAVGKMKILFVK